MYMYICTCLQYKEEIPHQQLDLLLSLQLMHASSRVCAQYGVWSMECVGLNMNMNMKVHVHVHVEIKVHLKWY